jgi:hypothetical protein
MIEAKLWGKALERKVVFTCHLYRSSHSIDLQGRAMQLDFFLFWGEVNPCLTKELGSEA